MDSERDHWSRKLEFFVVCLGFTVGLGNVWRFPHLMYTHGGGAFFIPYYISLFFMGIPLFIMEVHYGQFTSQGPLTIWEVNPLFKGLGYSMMILASIISIYYSVVVATAIYFFFASMQTPLPWTTCGNQWNTCWCRTFDMNLTLDNPLMWLGSAGMDCRGIRFSWDKIQFANEQYYYNSVLDKSKGFDMPGKIKWDLTLFNLLVWAMIACSLIKGIKTMGKVAYFSALSPYVLLTILNIRGVTLEGAHKGLIFYLKPDFSKLKARKVWLDAANQIFFSLGCSMGSLTAMSSYSRFKNNYIKDSVVIPLINALTSFLAGMAIFSAIGFISHTTGIPVNNVTSAGPGLTFVVYPVALSKMPFPQLWSVLFFFMLISLGLGTLLPYVETVLTGLQDEFTALRHGRNNVIFRLGVCFAFFLLGLPQTTQGGLYVLTLCDYFVAWPLLLIGFFELIALVWLYGEKRYTEDVYIMVGGYPVWWRIYRNYLHKSLIYVTPILILLILLLEAYYYKPLTEHHYNYPWWAELVGWGLVIFTMIWLPGYYIVRLVRAFTHRDTRTETFWMVVLQANQPTPDWGPRCATHRAKTRYDTKRVNTSKLLHYVSNRVNTNKPPHYDSNKVDTKDPPHEQIMPEGGSQITVSTLMVKRSSTSI